MENENKPAELCVYTGGTTWYNAKLKPPTVSGDYLVWHDDNRTPSVEAYSAKYDGWGILPDGRRDFETKSVEWWTVIIPPTVHE